MTFDRMNLEIIQKPLQDHLFLFCFVFKPFWMGGCYINGADKDFIGSESGYWKEITVTNKKSKKKNGSLNLLNKSALCCIPLSNCAYSWAHPFRLVIVVSDKITLFVNYKRSCYKYQNGEAFLVNSF